MVVALFGNFVVTAHRQGCEGCRHRGHAWTLETFLSLVVPSPSSNRLRLGPNNMMCLLYGTHGWGSSGSGTGMWNSVRRKTTSLTGAMFQGRHGVSSARVLERPCLRALFQCPNSFPRATKHFAVGEALGIWTIGGFFSLPSEEGVRLRLGARRTCPNSTRRSRSWRAPSRLHRFQDRAPRACCRRQGRRRR